MNMNETDEKFEEILQKAKERAGVETVRNIQAHLHKYQKSQHKITRYRQTTTSSNTSNWAH